MAYLHLNVDDELHKAFKIYCANKGVTMADEIRDAMLERITQFGQNEIIYDIKIREQKLREKDK